MNKREITEIVGSWLVISVAFGWIMRGNGSTLAQSFLPSLAIALVAVGTGFIFHELAHKYVAIHYGARAEFFAWPMGLVIALALAFGVGIVFAAPGAVYIFSDHLTKKQNGIISVVGPLTNIILGIAFFLLYSVSLLFQSGFWSTLLLESGFINFILAAFNLIPFGPLDGRKVFDWNKIVWAVLFVPLVFIWLFVNIGF